MTLAYVLHTLLVTPLFASRAFLATFLTAVAARLVSGLALDEPGPTVQALLAAPPWFTGDLALAILGVLALVEVVAARDPDLRRLMDELDLWAKGALSLGVSLALLPPEVGPLLGPALSGSVAGAGSAVGLGPGGPELVAAAWALVPAGLVVGLAALRRGLWRALADLDEGDDLGLQRVVAWGESAWVVAGFAVVVVLPLLAALAFAGTIGVLVLLQRRVRAMEEARRVACGSCGRAIHAAAPHCPGCGEAHEAAALGWLGLPSEHPAPLVHAAELVAHHRCPRCAERLPEHRPDQRCPACGASPFADRAALEAWLEGRGRSVVAVALVSFCVGLVPVLGIVPAVVLVRLRVVSPLACWVPPLAAVRTRWTVRGLNLLLILLQPVPILGAATLPAIAWLDFALWRRALRAAGEGLGG